MAIQASLSVVHNNHAVHADCLLLLVLVAALTAGLLVWMGSRLCFFSATHKLCKRGSLRISTTCSIQVGCVMSGLWPLASCSAHSKRCQCQRQLWHCPQVQHKITVALGQPKHCIACSGCCSATVILCCTSGQRRCCMDTSTKCVEDVLKPVAELFFALFFKLVASCCG